MNLDADWLERLGLGELASDEKNLLLQHAYETLELRVGLRLASEMTDDELNEFEGLIDNDDEVGAMKWLEDNYPEYKSCVHNEIEYLEEQLRSVNRMIFELVSNEPLIEGKV